MLTSFTPLLRLGLRSVLAWLDARTQAPIMRQSINDGSRRYFQQEQSQRGASDIDELLAGATLAEFPNPRRARERVSTTTPPTPSAAWLRVLGYVALGALATLWLLAAIGYGPFVRVPIGDVGTRLEQGFFGVIGLWLSLTSIHDALQEARELARARRILRSTASQTPTPDPDRAI